MAVWVELVGKKYQVVVQLKGKRKKKVIGTDKRAAEQVAAAIRKAITSGTYTQNQVQYAGKKHAKLFKEYAEYWFNLHSPLNPEGKLKVIYSVDDRLHWRPSTTIRNEEILRLYLLPIFGERPMYLISKTEIKDYFVQLSNQGTLHPKTVGSIFSTLRTIFNEAIEDEVITTNPVLGISKYINKRSNKKLEQACFLTREEVVRMLQTAQDYYRHYYPFLLCASRTGLRLGELIGLRWEDLDFNGKFIEVKRSYFRGFETAPKSRKTRKVDMSQQLHDELILWRYRQKELFESLKEPCPEFVFCTGKGRRINPNYFRELVWSKCLAKAGIRYIKLHALRHSFCSFLLQQGESPVYVQQQMGHHSIEQTVGTYGHLIPGANRSAVNKLDDADLVPKKCLNLTLIK